MRNLAALTKAGGWPDKGPFTLGMKEGDGAGWGGGDKNESVILSNTDEDCLQSGKLLSNTYP